jgi:capsule biosynthesis phosphatase
MNSKTFVVDIDDTFCKSPLTPEGNLDYPNGKPIQKVVDKINKLYSQGHQIILFTARGMRTFGGDVEKIEAKHRPILTKWLAEHNVSYHKLILGKPWYKDYFFIDDRGITINQFVSYEADDFDKVIRHNNPTLHE